MRADSIPQRTTWSASRVAAPAIVSTRTEDPVPAAPPGVPGSSSPSPASATAAA